MTDEALSANAMPATDADETTELYEHYHFVVDKGQTPQRMDQFLTLRLAGISRNKVQMAAKAGCIRVNGKAAKNNYKVKPRDEISILLPTPPHHLELIPQEMPLDIVYEDRDVLVVNKPAGLVVHPGVANFDGTLLNGLLFHLKDDELSSPYLVHRIDKDTSGLLLVAKNEAAQIQLAKQFFEHATERKYIALAWGDMPEDDGTVDANLDRDPRDRRIRAVVEPPQGKHAVTHWHVLRRFGYVTLVECVLETGRTHQIRAHMRHISHPLFSDAAYGGDKILKGTTFSKYRVFVENCFRLLPRQALHAAVLGFEHPTSRQRLHFESPLPSDMENAIEQWEAYANGSCKQ